MKKFIALAIIAGVAIPLFAQTREFYYGIVLVIALFVFVLAKKKPLTLADMLILFILTIPLHTFRFGGEEEFIRLSEIAFVPLFFWWAAQRFLSKVREPIVIRKEFILLFLYLLINVASLTNAMYLGIAIKRILILAYLFLLTYMVTDIVNSRQRLTAVIHTSILISAFSGIIAAAQSVFSNLLIFSKVAMGKVLGVTLYRAGVGWHDPNYYALYLAMNMAFTLSLLLGPGKKQPWLKLCFFLQMLGLMATFSRTAFLGLLLVILYLLFHFKRKTLAALALALIMTTAAVTATATFSIYKKSPFLAAVLYRIPDKKKLAEQPFLVMGHRYAAFRANWAMFLDHPVLGVGPFMAVYNFYKYRPAGYNYPLAWLASHNQYLQLLSEKGIFGFLVFIGFLYIILKKLTAYMKSASDPDEAAYLMCFKAAILVYLIASFFLETSYELQFWLTIGLSMALFTIIDKERPNA